MSQFCFSAADILIPGVPEPEAWAVLACDQFTSQPEYWRQVAALTEGKVSAAELILPESELGSGAEERVEAIHAAMLRYLRGGVFREYPDAYVYTERTLQNGSLRRGIVGKVDLEAYDYTGREDALVRATERTVVERIPPRTAVRRGAALELPHILLLCDDDRNMLIEPLSRKKASLPALYSFELMLGGGHVAGWLVQGEEKAALDRRLLQYAAEQRAKHPGREMLFAVGDGNHSLAAAKACYEERKAARAGEDLSGLPARYALCELNNIHDPAQRFEPIHRIVKRCDARLLLRDLRAAFPGTDGREVRWLSGGEEGALFLPCGKEGLALTPLQDVLDGWLEGNAGELDYIHGEEALRSLALAEDAVGFLLPAIEKDMLFPMIQTDGALPRKTFSMGEAVEKRYYLEARKIL